ncbi:hypothetical protein ILUMI_06385 [Ignelater luminosus]|uniref:Uncharacterized protein n=1 Tax=Ignelater luminosus TaxID=2038154 RepID=A0A8K0D5V4_IGNLU|nr:hypothetical protein ILUMI_06385 [Ignelater luminosus]
MVLLQEQTDKRDIANPTMVDHNEDKKHKSIKPKKVGFSIRDKEKKIATLLKKNPNVPERFLAKKVETSKLTVHRTSVQYGLKSYKSSESARSEFQETEVR